MHRTLAQRSASAAGAVLWWAALGAAPAGLQADALDDVQRRGVLIWGADQQGGAPLTFPDEQDPSVLRGFEVELVDMIARELSVRQQFQQGQWDQLPLLLDRGQIDVVFNGYELTPARAERYRCSRPYFAFSNQLIARRDGTVASWEDLERQPGKPPRRLGILVGSSVEAYLKKHFGDGVELVSYDNNTDAMQHVESGLLDATVCDDCVALYYVDRYPHLRLVGRPSGTGYYVAMYRRSDERLAAAIDAAIGRIIDDGRLKTLYDKWDLAGRQQTLALRDAAPTTGASLEGAWRVVRNNLSVLLQSAGMTVLLACISMPIAMALGLATALGRQYGPRPLAWGLGVYVEVLRGTPLMLQLYAIFFTLPEFGIALPAMAAAILGLAVNYSAYEAEIYRAGLNAVPRGQMEAALSLGMSRAQAVRRIIAPQAVRLVIPPITNDFIALFKDTSVCSVVTVVELTKQYNVLAQNTGAILQLATVTALLYLLMSYPLSLLTRWSENKLGTGLQHH